MLIIVKSILIDGAFIQGPENLVAIVLF